MTVVKSILIGITRMILGGLIFGLSGTLVIASVVFLGGVIPLPSVTSVTLWVTALISAVALASFLFYKKDTPLILMPKLIREFGEWWTVIPDSILRKSEIVQTLYCLATFWSVVYIAAAWLVLIALIPVVIIFLSGWYFCWLTSEVKVGRVQLWPWLVERLHKATAPSSPQNGAA